MTEEIQETKFVEVVPTDLWAAFEDVDQYPPEDAAELPAFDQARVYAILHQTAVPKPFRNAFQMPAEALEWAREGKDTDLLLWGYVGTGKTHAAVAAGTLRAGLHRKSFRFAIANKSLRVLKTFSNQEAMEDMRADLIRPDVLVLDDFGREKFTDQDVAVMTEVVDERRGSGKVTIFTTNVTPFKFEEHFGNPMTSRLVGGSRLLQMVGPDRRINP